MHCFSAGIYIARAFKGVCVGKIPLSDCVYCGFAFEAGIKIGIEVGVLVDRQETTTDSWYLRQPMDRGYPRPQVCSINYWKLVDFGHVFICYLVSLSRASGVDVCGEMARPAQLLFCLDHHMPSLLACWRCFEQPHPLLARCIDCREADAAVQIWSLCRLYFIIACYHQRTSL